MKKVVSMSVLCMFMACLPCKANNPAVVKTVFDALVRIGIGLGLEQIANGTSEWLGHLFVTDVTAEGEGLTQEGDKLAIRVTAPRQATIDADNGEYEYSCSAASTLAIYDAHTDNFGPPVPCSASLEWTVDNCHGMGSPFRVNGTSSTEKYVQNRCTATYSGGQAAAAPSTHLTYGETSPIDTGGGTDPWFPLGPPVV